MDEVELSIVVPVFEEAESLPELTERIAQVCESAGHSFETWYVDDGSADNSWEMIQRIHQEDPRFAGVRFRRNYGKSAALQQGFQKARGRYVVTLDADLQDDPAEIPGLIAALEEGYDLVSGWKKERRDPVSKRLPSKFFNTVTRVVSGIPLHDFNCGLKAYRREVVQELTLYGELHRYIPLLAKWEGFDRITEREVEHHPRKYGKTKFGLERFIRGFLDLISVIFLTRFAARPMHFFGSLGTASFLLGFVICLWLTFEKVFLGYAIGDRPMLLLGLLLILFGAQIFTTGLLGEMMVRQKMERADVYQVRDILTPGVPQAV